MLPFQPESTAQLRARFPEAIKEIQDVLAIIKDRSLRPGLKRKHVFDFQDGCRLIISIDREGLIKLFHVSSSINLEHGMKNKLKFISQMEYTKHVINHINELEHPKKRIYIEKMFTPKGVFHIFSEV